MRVIVTSRRLRVNDPSGSEMTDFAIKRGDTLPAFEAVLVRDDGTPLDLTGASVRFVMAPVGGGPAVVDAPAAVVDTVTGAIRYTWGDGDTAAAGSYRTELRISFPGGHVSTAPTDGYVSVDVVPCLS